ncbi:MAG: hypothetical protein P8188_01830 [Gemmatimonadota bacterium]
MHLLLTDRLICPRCGPGFGLVLRADQLRDRRVASGGLGCPNCREVYPVVDGVGDLRPPPRGATEAGDPAPLPDPATVLATQALLGVADGTGEILLLGGAARFGPGLAERLPQVEVVTAGPVPAGLEPESPPASAIRVGSRLPFDSRSLRGVVLEGDVPVPLLREAARVVAAGHRVVVREAGGSAAAMLMAAGLTVRLDEDGVVVAGR